MSGKVDPRYGVASSPRLVEPGEPVPKGGGRYSVGKPYVIAGRTYVPEENEGYRAEGIASWYGDDFHGRQTANGEVFDMHSIAAAHPTLPLPSYVRVTNLRNKRSLIVRVNDRGPYHANRVIDVSQRAAKLLDFQQYGTARVRVEYVGRAAIQGSDDVKLAATLRQGNEAPAPSEVRVASAKPFIPEFFDPNPITRGAVPTPPERPFELGDNRMPPVAARRVQTTTEMSAIARAPIAPPASSQNRPQLAGTATPASVPARAASAEPVSFATRFGSAAAPVDPNSGPVSAFAPGQGSGAVMSGRGLY